MKPNAVLNGPLRMPSAVIWDALQVARSGPACVILMGLPALALRLTLCAPAVG